MPVGKTLIPKVSEVVERREGNVADGFHLPANLATVRRRLVERGLVIRDLVAFGSGTVRGVERHESKICPEHDRLIYPSRIALRTGVLVEQALMVVVLVGAAILNVDEVPSGDSL